MVFADFPGGRRQKHIAISPFSAVRGNEASEHGPGCRPQTEEHHPISADASASGGIPTLSVKRIRSSASARMTGNSEIRRLMSTRIAVSL